MKPLKNNSVAFLIMLFSILLLFYFSPNNTIFIAIELLFLGSFIFNFIIRKKLSFKNYFTSKYNPFTIKIFEEKTYDIPKQLMFEKIIEVINDSNFKLVDTDKEKFEILAISQIKLTSWGENLYIDFETKGDKTIMKFCSSSLFGITWGKNEKNYYNLLDKIETSLVV